MIPQILGALLLVLSPFAAEPAHAEARFRENRLVFARAIYSAIDVIRSHAHDRHDLVRGFLNLAHSSATTDQARNRLALLLRDLTFEKATHTLTNERLWRIKRQEMQALLAYERIVVPGDEGAIEGNLVEDLLKATLFGDMKDEVSVEYYPRDQKREILALVLTYISDPRAGRYDQEVREFVYGEGMPDPDALGPDVDDPLLKEPPSLGDLQAYREWVRTREIPYLPPGEEMRESDVRPGQQRRQIIFNAFETTIPLPGKSAESRVLLRQMRTMAEAAAKNGAPFRPKV
ncbi:MAG TPA: hypothetical protein VM598_13500, partial [Bdellovibrionota bacterium]|nr:hypothetical protein [Bdellovibrionota bacterium]